MFDSVAVAAANLSQTSFLYLTITTDKILSNFGEAIPGHIVISHNRRSTAEKL